MIEKYLIGLFSKGKGKIIPLVAFGVSGRLRLQNF